MPEIIADGFGFALVKGGRQGTCVRWEDVVEIVAYKRDLFACDEVCMGFRRRGLPHYVEVNESQRGFRQLQGQLRERFALDIDSWLPAVAVPAFKTRWTVLWGEARTLSDDDEFICE